MKTVLSPLALWYYDLGSCLQSCMATILQYKGQDPTLVLGACWDFYHSPEHFQREEYYYPCRWPGLADSLMPYHPVHSAWHQPVDADAGWQEVKQRVLQGDPVIVAVDNFHLPFRPAYHDVHAGHLLVVYGVDEEHDAVYVADSPPPGYLGPMSIAQLQAARGSHNPPDERDFFFSSTPVSYRWIDVQISHDFPTLDEAWVKQVVAQNVLRFQSPDDAAAYSGLPGMHRYFSHICAQETESERNHAFEELYTMGWGIQASTGLHADFLLKAGSLLAWPELSEAGRHVAQLAHHWTALRMQAAHARLHADDMPAVMRRLQQHSAQLVSEQTQIVERLGWLARQ